MPIELIFSYTCRRAMQIHVESSQDKFIKHNYKTIVK